MKLKNRHTGDRQKYYFIVLQRRIIEHIVINYNSFSVFQRHLSISSLLLSIRSNINEIQAVAIAKVWLEKDINQSLPISDVTFIPGVENDETDGFTYNQPAHWLVVFKCNVPEGFHPDEIFVRVDPETGVIEVPPMM